MPARPATSAAVTICRHARRRALLAGASVLAFISVAPVEVHARSLNGSGGGGAVSAPNIASEAAAQAARQAAAAARQTQDSLARAARSVQDMQGLQAAARAAAVARQTSMTAPVAVPNGIGAGGLLPNMPAGWSGANGPTQNVEAGGQTQVNIRQTTQQAILNWQSFNVGARTTLTFDQQGNSNWVALNRVNNATAPSQILGNIKADGHVYVINRSGVIFGGSSQVNVGSLIASTADIDDTHFRANGIFSSQTGGAYAPSFTAAGGKVVVESGASISTRAPSSVTSGGGYVLMIGSQVENAGSIATPKGQTLLAAGDDFVLRRGFGTEGNATSTTRGIEIAPQLNIDSASGSVRNSGLIFAQQGDVTLAGRTISQGGVLLATTSVNTRGTIHLLNSATDDQGSVTLTADSVTAILPELDSSETALDSQRDALIASSAAANLLRATSATGVFDNLSLLADRQDQSRIEIVTGGQVTFQNRSQTMAQGGQVAVSAGSRVFAESGSRIDVSGTRDVLLPMSANQVLVNVQGNELRDSPVNRDSGALINKNVWIDIRDLVLMPAGTGGYAGDRYYTKGGLLELGGYLSNTAHKIGEWTAVGGTITLAAPEVIAQAGATFDISGGSVSYDGGRIYSSKLIGADGRLYSFDNAPADMKFIGAAGGFSRTHNIQGKVSDQLTEVWSTVFDRSSSWRYEAGYTVGRDAGRLNLSTPTALFAGDIVAGVVTGERQNSARAGAVADGYKQVQNATPLAGTLAVGQFSALGRVDLYNSDVRIGVIADVTANLDAKGVLPAERTNTAWFDAGRLSQQGLGRIEIGTRDAIDITGNLTLANGGALDLTAAVIDIKANVTAHGGSINTTNVLSTVAFGTESLTSNGTSRIAVRSGAVLDLSGVKKLEASDRDLNALAYLNGGSVSLQSTEHMVFEDNAVIDVSSGAAMLRTGNIQGGRGGNVTLTANLNSTGTTGELTLAGDVRGYGFAGGGTLALQAGQVTIGAAPNVAEPGTLMLAADFFSKGFSAYTITGNRGVTVADGAVVDVTMPVYRPASGSDAGKSLEVWTPQLYVENARTGVLTQRGGASLSLQAGSNMTLASDLASVGLTVGKNAAINVDPGKSITLISAGQLTMDGTLHANGGNIALKTVSLVGVEAEHASGAVNSRSIWIGETARLDVSAKAVVARDARGRRYGLVGNGGSIVIGGEIDAALGQATAAENFIIIRPGAVLDASGTAATLDIPGLGAVDVASNGGSISLISNNGLYLDGTMIARAGGAGAAGGRLNVALQMLEYRIESYDPDYPVADPLVRMQREIVIAERQGKSVLAGDLQAGAADPALVYGYGRLGTDTVTNGGFDNLAVMSEAISFDGSLTLRTAQSIDFASSRLALSVLAPLDSQVSVRSAYVRLGQDNYATTSQSPVLSRLSITTPRLLPVGAHLDVSAELIDIRDKVSLDAIPTTIRSAGDIRFVQGVAPNASDITTRLTSPVSLTLQAAQIYPATGVRAQVNVGERLSDDGSLEYDPAQVLRIVSNGAGVPQVPYSVFGDLTLMAGTIEQGGVLRAPLGRLELGKAGSNVILLPGSVTSVSGAGLQMPYGGTVDGLTYKYDGKAVALTGIGAGGGSFGSTLLIGLTLTGSQVDVREGAVLDMSGGGELLGAGFVAGRGGSTDARYASLMQVVDGKITQPGLTTNPVYAIVPGAQHAYAPAGGERSALDPVIGQQITLRESIPGLPAGTYTLMPASYALLPGAFRVELNGASTQGAAIASLALANGSFAASAQLGIANTGIADRLSRQVILTSGAVMRNYSKYDETSYADFVRADALRIGVPRAMIEADAKSLLLNLQAGNGADAFRFRGESRFAVAKGGFGGSLTVTTGDYYSEAGDIEIVAAGAQATAGFFGVTLDAGALSDVGASRLVIGGTQYVDYGKMGTTVGTGLGARDLVLRSGAVLSGPEVFLSAAGNLSIEQGAGIITLGRGKAAYDAADGFHYGIGRSDQAVSMVAVSNGVLSMLPPVGETPSGNLQIGGCLTTCAGETQIYSEGTVVLSTSGQFTLDDAVRYGTRNLTLAVQAINVGDSAALAAAAAGNVLPAGLTLNQSVLNRLLRGDTQYGAPALQTLALSAANSVNFYGSVTLDTIDPVTGKSTLDTLVLGTPAIYGGGTVGDVATIRTGNLIWKGATSAPGTVIAGGAGTGSGTLNIEAKRIEFGYGPGSQPTGISDDARLALGFADVQLRASDRVTANQKGSLSVYQSQGAYQPGTGYAYSGGNLTITAPLVTGEAGSVNRIIAGGSLVLTAPANGGTAPTTDAALGAELSLTGRDVIVDTLLALPSGKLTITAEHDLTLTDRAKLDMAGRTIAFNDVTKYSWGGDVVLNSRSGSIRQAAGSVIDLSAQNNRGGSLKATALADLAGVVDLRGSILGSTSGVTDAGGTLVPYKAAAVEIRGQRLGDSGSLDTQFAALNQRLNAGGVFGARSFQFKQGDLTVGSDVKAGQVDISIDNGSLTVIGTIDASGAQVGSIVLAAKNNLIIGGSALLDAHGTILRVDSYGKIIDAPNRAMVDLTSRDGTLTLASGARIDLRHGTDSSQNDGLARGTLELNAARTGETSGDVRIDASGAVDIRGARSIAVNATWRYDDADYGNDPAAGGRPYQEITQDYLDRKHVQSGLFMDAALLNGALMNGKLAGLRGYTDAFHLRPGVAIVSATPDGDLVVKGDLDLSKYRYDSVNPNSQKTGIYGSGEPGALSIRAGGNLNIYGSITDGFAPPPATQDDNGWLLLPGTNINGGDIVVPRGGVVIADGTAYEGGTTLNYDLPIKAMKFDANIVIPGSSALAEPLTVPAGTVFSAAVRDASGSILYAAGTILPSEVTLPSETRFDAGMRLPGTAELAALVWPQGVPLPLQIGNPTGNSTAIRLYVLNGNTTLPQGALLPAATDIKLANGATSIDLRPSVNTRQGSLWALAKMLPEGSQSWSVRLVAGADTEAADGRIVQANPERGDLQLADHHYGMFGKTMPPSGGYVWSQAGVDRYGRNGAVLGAPVTALFGTICVTAPQFCVAVGVIEIRPTAGSARFSVIRTGAADLELLAGGNLRMDSLYGVYTAGTSSVATYSDDPYNLPRAVGTNGKVLVDEDGAFEKFVNGGSDSTARAWYPTGGGNLTIKAGADLTGDVMQNAGVGPSRPNPKDTGYNTAAIGNWLWRQGSGSTLGEGADQATAWFINFGTYVRSGTADKMVGFTGFGTLGGGNLRVDVGGNAGILAQRGGVYTANGINPRSEGLVLAIGSTGRVLADGSISLTGGGDIDMRVGGTLNAFTLNAAQNQDNADKDAALIGSIANLRGNMTLYAGGLGALPLDYVQSSVRDTRAADPFVAGKALAQIGLVLAPGDSSFNISARGDLVIKGVNDPGRVTLANQPAFQLGGQNGRGDSWFSLWTAHSAINLFSAGGDLTPITVGEGIAATDLAYVYPSILTAVAASGSLYYGNAANYNRNVADTGDLLLAPSANGRLELLARNSIYAEGFAVSQSGAANATLATPFRPGFVVMDRGVVTHTNVAADANPSAGLPLFAFGPDSVSVEWAGIIDPARFYAVTGDLVGVSSGRLIGFDDGDAARAGQKRYQGGPTRMMAGRDIVSSGTPIGLDELTSSPISYTSVDNLFVNRNASDVSMVSAGRDILYSSFSVAGPGSLQLSAGRNILMADKGRVSSVGPAIAGDNRPGAGIAMQAGIGVKGPDYAALLRYLDPVNLVPEGTVLEGSGKVAKTYEKELAAWLKQRTGFAGTDAQARAVFDALAPEQQQIFLRQVYFAELTEGGREYNNTTSLRYGSYLRGRAAIAALFPTSEAASGDITMFGGSGVQTLSGGDIQMLTPNGKLVVGVEGEGPPSTAGLVTQGSGNIRIYSQGSVLLGLSRIMTTFGGNIVAWTAGGDINAGRGAKTTVVYTPPKRIYDIYGNVALSPTVPSSGAGIATLNPIPEVKAGDIDLIAPLGTIDAGEAGIRVSGNINLAALQIVNASNISVQGSSSGIPAVQAPSIRASLSTSNATAGTQQTVAPQANSNAQPSVIIVEVLGYGGGANQNQNDDEQDRNRDRRSNNYDTNNQIRVLGNGSFSEDDTKQLTALERETLATRVSAPSNR